MQEEFHADELIFIPYTGNKHDAVWKVMQKELKAVQCVGDLPTTLDDIKVIRDPLEEKYKFVHLTGKDGEFDLSDNPEWEKVRKTRQHLIKLYR